MQLGFVNPAFLWGGLLVAVPLLIHLLHRRRVRRVRFPAIAFLLRSEARNARRLRLRRILLLLARSALMLAVPLALARPYLAPPRVAATPGGPGPAAVVVLLDTSLSMRYRLDGRSLFERGQEAALEALAALGPEDAVALLPCDDGIRAPLPSTTYDLSLLRPAIRQARAGFRGSDLGACLSGAVQVLAASPLPRKRLVVITDLTASAWRLDAPPPRVPSETGEVAPEVVVVDVAEGERLPNRWIDGFEVAPALALGPKGYAFTVGVRGSGGASAQDLPVSVARDGRVVTRGFVSLEPDGAGRKTLAHAFERGGEVEGEARIAGDALPEDDVRPFLLSVRRDLQVLVVDGEPSGDRRQDEVFFLERALAPGRGASGIVSRVVDLDGFTGAELERTDVVLMLNVPAPSEAQAAALEAFVREGGGLLVSAGDRVEPDRWNTALGGVLPAALHLPKAAEGGATRLSAVRWTHPVFSVFSGEGREGFGSARFEQYLLTRPPRAGASVLAAFADDAPALLAAPYGEGRVVLFTSTVDLEWADLAIRTAFLPLVQQLVGWLSRSLDERPDPVSALGTRRWIPVPAGTDTLTVRPPEGRPVRFRGAALASGRVAFDQTEVPGLYQVLASRSGGEAAPVPGASFVVPVPPGESDTSRLERQELLTFLGGGEVSDTVVASGGDADRRPLWPIFLLLAVAALIGEGVLLRR